MSWLPIADFAVNAGSKLIDTASSHWFQGQTWRREDNAIQRRVADLKAAGLSPTLAAGSAAASSPAHLQPLGESDIAGKAINYEVGKKNIARTNQEIAVMAQQLNNLKTQQNLMRNQEIGQELRNQLDLIEIGIKTHDADIIKNTPLTSGALMSSDTKSIAGQLFGAARKALEKDPLVEYGEKMDVLTYQIFRQLPQEVQRSLMKQYPDPNLEPFRREVRYRANAIKAGD